MECANCGGAWLCASCSPVAVYSADPKPDRAARIRARAERLLDAAWLAAPGMASGALTEHDKTVEGAFVLARFEIDELDRLEREEREKERDHGLGAQRETVARRRDGADVPARHAAARRRGMSERPSWMPSREELSNAYELDGYEDEGCFPALDRLIERAVLKGQIEALEWVGKEEEGWGCFDCKDYADDLRARLSELEGSHE